MAVKKVCCLPIGCSHNTIRSVFHLPLSAHIYPTQVTTPVLKLFAELVQNRSQRLQFDVSSPNGILLFREASKIICTYGTRILNVNVSKEQARQQSKPQFPIEMHGPTKVQLGLDH